VRKIPWVPMDRVRSADYGGEMKVEDVKPAHCYARAQRLLGAVRAIRTEMGRSEDARPVPEISGAEPREVYFEAIAAWRKAARLGAEVGAPPPALAPEAPRLTELKPGHVLQVLDGIAAQLEAIATRVGADPAGPEAAIEDARRPSDVLMTVIRINRELSRALERPFTPSDVYRTVALAAAYANRLGGHAGAAPFERGRQPAQCYERLEACLARATALIGKRGGAALTARGTPPDVSPGDVYDLANLVLGEVAFLHALVPTAAPLHAFELQATGHRLPAHVHQLARTLEAQLAALS
jgi:hypothetical protein